MNFFARSAVVLLVLYGLVFVIADMALVHQGAPLWIGVVFALAMAIAQFGFGPMIIEHVFDIDWDRDKMPARQREFVERLCAQQEMPMVRLGVIPSGTPNAFSFGRFRSDARVVVTQGMLDILTEDEINGVLAHEVGHVAHNDFAVMTVAAAAPLMLYQIYVWIDRTNTFRSVSTAAYVAYMVAQYMVLSINRTREYWADHFAAECTHAPAALSSALVKIAYGLVKVDGEYKESLQSGSAADKKALKRQFQLGGALAMMGVANLRAGASLALTMSNPAQAAAVMKWDLSNPWARLYELSSTHPLTAMRIRALNRAAEEMHVAEGYPLPVPVRQTAGRWLRLVVEATIWGLPVALLALGFVLSEVNDIARRFGHALPHHTRPWLLAACGATWAVRILFRYRGSFQPAKAAELLEDLEVSEMTPRAVELEGEVIGNGVPGYFWSPDLVLQDESGQMFLLYRSSIPFGRLFFAMTDASRFLGERVTVRGWYRRGLRPYVEIARLDATVTKLAPGGSAPLSLFARRSVEAAPYETERLTARSYSRWIQLGLSALAMAIGLFWALS